jgi:hypothetical protein
MLNGVTIWMADGATGNAGRPPRAAMMTWLARRSRPASLTWSRWRSRPAMAARTSRAVLSLR